MLQIPGINELITFYFEKQTRRIINLYHCYSDKYVNIFNVDCLDKYVCVCVYMLQLVQYVTFFLTVSI